MDEVIKCPNCGSQNMKPNRNIKKKNKGKVLEGKQYRCGNCNSYLSVYR